MPEIGLNGLLLDSPYSGSAVYSRNLAPLLPQVASDLQFRLYTRNAELEAPNPPSQRLSTPFRRLNRGSGPGARLDKLTWETVALPVAAALRREALIHSLYFAAPPISTSPLVVTVHDVIPLVLPGYHRTRQSAWYSRFMVWTVRRAAAVITVSQHSKRDICRVLGIPDDRVTVTYEAVDEVFQPNGVEDEADILRSRYRVPERYLLYTGGAEKRKNITLLVRAWEQAREAMRRQECKLVIVADFPPPDPLYPDIPRLIREVGLSAEVYVVPRVAQSDMPALYRSALGFCFPSRYEGFGFTPLEAMACGAPVVASNATSLPEVVGEGGWLLPPDDAGAWAEAMIRLASSDGDRRHLVERARQQVGRFSWRVTAEQTAQVYRNVLGR